MLNIHLTPGQQNKKEDGQTRGAILCSLMLFGVCMCSMYPVRQMINPWVEVRNSCALPCENPHIHMLVKYSNWRCLKCISFGMIVHNQLLPPNRLTVCSISCRLYGDADLSVFSKEIEGDESLHEFGSSAYVPAGSASKGDSRGPCRVALPLTINNTQRMLARSKHRQADALGLCCLAGRRGWLSSWPKEEPKAGPPTLLNILACVKRFFFCYRSSLSCITLPLSRTYNL